eukprot:TRINITY_DN9416_c0_g5_i1.p2 TRINITY_DN9416_c0_g5~~TRINITY_DN9416_c0_g5_i1.p2  ORF type:complete len:119 (+),score=1.06 TRINITY_DN9416_c0_g5_i1:123-479(+)
MILLAMKTGNVEPAKMVAFDFEEIPAKKKCKLSFLTELGHCTLQDLVKIRSDLKTKWKDDDLLLLLKECIDGLSTPQQPNIPQRHQTSENNDHQARPCQNHRLWSVSVKRQQSAHHSN